MRERRRHDGDRLILWPLLRHDRKSDNVHVISRPANVPANAPLCQTTGPALRSIGNRSRRRPFRFGGKPRGAFALQQVRRSCCPDRAHADRDRRLPSGTSVPFSAGVRAALAIARAWPGRRIAPPSVGDPPKKGVESWQLLSSLREICEAKARRLSVTASPSQPVMKTAYQFCGFEQCVRKWTDIPRDYAPSPSVG